MIDQLFIALTEALTGGGLLPALAAFGWGVASIVLSPCHLVSIPLVVAFTSNQRPVTARTGLVFGSLFAGGMLVTVLLIGLVTAALGRFLGNTGSVGVIGQLVAAALLVVVGLYLAGILRLAFIDNLSGPQAPARRGRLAALVAGLVFGLTVGPCTFAYLAPILAITFTRAGTDLGQALWLFGWFAVGHGGVLVLAGAFSGQVEKLLHWNSRQGGLVRWTKFVLGILIVAGAVLVGYDAITKL